MIRTRNDPAGTIFFLSPRNTERTRVVLYVPYRVRFGSTTIPRVYLMRCCRMSARNIVHALLIYVYLYVCTTSCAHAVTRTRFSSDSTRRDWTVVKHVRTNNTRRLSFHSVSRATSSLTIATRVKRAVDSAQITGKIKRKNGTEPRLYRYSLKSLDPAHEARSTLFERTSSSS